ncbi:MAG: alpha/beta fold hydrolase [Dehalococcoidia bacterium]
MAFAMNHGVRIHYEVEGSGVPLILHPGFISVIPDWSIGGYVNDLKGEYRLILIDPRGQGQSEKPP